jgi:hypothetical protein
MKCFPYGLESHRAPQVGALTDIQDEYGMYNDIMGTCWGVTAILGIHIFLMVHIYVCTSALATR